MMPTAKRTLLLSTLLFLLLCVAAVASLATGTVAIPFRDVLSFMRGAEITEEQRTILLSIRLPRVLLAVTAGGGLSIAGAVFQALLRNPLAEPYILGVSSGGTVGAILALGLGVGMVYVSVPLASFVGSATVMLLVYSIAMRYGKVEPTTLLLAGVMVGAFFTAMILLLVVMFGQEVRNAFLWLMGNLGSAEYGSLSVIAPAVLTASLILFFLSRNYNLIATGEESAEQLGVNVERVKRISYFLASLITGFVVSASGVIGFVGLIVPHVCRLLFGSDHRVLLPASFLSGAAFLVVVDLLARTIISPSEIPVGAVTAMLGAPVFVWLLRRRD
jgi:iron complex transport system permease protein